MTNSIRYEKHDPEWKRIATKWMQEGKPTRVLMPEGYYLAIQDNGEWVFVRENAQASKDGSSFDKVYGG